MFVEMKESKASFFARAAVIPGRSLTRSKAPSVMFDVGSGPNFTSGGNGCRVFGTDDKAYIDMLCALGAVSLGYAGPGQSMHVCQAAHPRLYSLPHVAEIEAAESVLKYVAPWASHVRFTKTGSEATHAAYRVAKAATGRRLVLVGDWAYHGWHEWATERVAWGSTWSYPGGQASWADFLDERTPPTVSYKLGMDFDLLDEIGHRVAAVFVEPPRWESVEPSWLSHVREWCTRHGALMVTDEMIWGGRWARGGSIEYFDWADGSVVPDLACFGKAIGNGASIACVVGREALAEHGTIASGTYSGEASALNAVKDTLFAYAAHPVIDTLWKRGRQLMRGLKEACTESPYGVVVQGEPVHLRLAFADDYTGPGGTVGPNGLMLGRRFSAEMASRGVLWHPACANVCYAHAEADIERVVEASIDSMRAMRIKP